MTPTLSVEDAPASVAYGEAFPVRVESPAPLIEFALVRPSSVTHSFNVDQRWVGLQMSLQGGDRFRLGAPPRPDVAPPGWYLLTALDEHRCPAEARWVHLQ